MVFERFCDFIADIFQTDKDSLSRETSFSEDLGAEEEDWQEMFMIIEEEFDISLSENRCGGHRHSRGIIRPYRRQNV